MMMMKWFFFNHNLSTRTFWLIAFLVLLQIRSLQISQFFGIVCFMFPLNTYHSCTGTKERKIC